MRNLWLSIKVATFCAAVIPLLASVSAQATLIGDQVTLTNIVDGVIFQGPIGVIVVDPGTEVPSFGQTWDIDIGSASILLTCNGNPQGGCGQFQTNFIDSYLFEDLDWVGVPGAVVGGVSLDPSSTAASAVANSSLSFGADSVRIDFGVGTTGTAGEFVLINLRFIPEPSTFGLFALGLVGLAGLSGRRKTQGCVRLRHAGRSQA